MAGEILKREDAEKQAGTVPFQFQDVRVMAAKVLKRAAEQAERKLMAAEKQAQDIEKAAYTDGYEKGHGEGYPKGEAEGRAAGDQAARQEFQHATQSVIPLLQTLASELQERKVALEAQAEADLLQLALSIAKRIVRHELSLDPQRIVPLVHEAVSLASDRSDLLLYVHPDDLKALESELPDLRNTFTDLGKVHVEPEETVTRGGLRLVGKEGEIDLRLEEQFSAIERALLGDGATHVDDGDDAETLPPPAEMPPPTPETALPGPDALDADGVGEDESAPASEGDESGETDADVPDDTPRE